MHTATRLSTAINASALEQSINEIVRRHESLRTVFQAVDGEPVQVVAAFLNLELQLTDLRHLEEVERENEALRIVTEEAQRPFDLASWPLLRTRLIQLGDADCIFVLTIHHIVCDFWSLNVIQDELTAHYEAFCTGQPSALPDLPVQYADYAAWEWKWLQGPVGAAHLDYWKKQLADLPMLRLPTDRPRPRISSIAGAAHDFSVGEALYHGLVQLSQREKVTLFMTVLAAFQTLLHRYTGQDDIVVGTPVANRNRAEIENLVGLFVNSLVLRTDFSDNPRFRDLLGRVREGVLDAFAHQDLPFERLVHELNPKRGADHNPLFQVHFQLFSGSGAVESGGPLAGEPLAAEGGTAKFDLALDLWEYPDGLWGQFEYSTELFDRETIVRMEQHFRNLLEGIVADPDQRLSELPLLSAQERQQLLVEWNRTEADYARDKCLHELFDVQAKRIPNAIALSFRQTQVTYRELSARANQLGRYLQSHGVGPEVIVAICVERSIEMIVGLLGILKAGGAYLPLDPNDPCERLRFIMQNAQPRLLLTQRKFVERVSTFAPAHLCLDTEWYLVAGFSAENPISTVDSRNLAYVIYTSGSAGVPKGVSVHSQAAANHLLWMQSALPLNVEDRVLQKYPFSFDASVCEIFGSLLAGARLVITEPAEHWDISEFIQLLFEHQITVLDVLPSMLHALLEEEAFKRCGSLRRVVCGGEPLSPELRDLFFEHVNGELHNIYGPTEATIGATHWTCAPGRPRDCVPIGRPIANTQVYVVDRWLNPVPIGVHGELYIGGEGVARGYLNQPELTSERFIHDWFSDKLNARLYRTGDMARYLPDGNLEYLGRVDQQVKVRGHRVEPAEIERTLSRNPMVQECVVLPIEDEAGRCRLATWIAPVPDEPEFWPSVGEYDVYDELLYYAMTHDEVRNRGYQSAIRKSVKGKVVLDIGTGADAILARFCVEAGAERVYAIEMRDDAWRRATELVEELGLASRISLIHGDSIKAQLPEKVDVCVSEILGTIGSSEGVIRVLNDARRFLRDGGIMIPRRCVTRVAPVALPEELTSPFRLNELPRLYAQRVFGTCGYPFDLRMCIKNFPPGQILSESQVFEDLDFSGLVDPEYEAQITCRIERDSRLDGFLLWLNLYPGQDEWLDSLRHRLSWLPVFLPVFYPGVDVSADDVIRAKCLRRPGANETTTDYEMSGEVVRKRGEPVPFSYYSPQHTFKFKGNPFYESLFSSADGGPGEAEMRDQSNQAKPEGTARGFVPTLRRYLQDQLPEYMIPSSFVVLSELPRTPTGKIDRRALPKPGHAHVEREGIWVGATEMEKAIADVWREVLDIEQVGIDDNFFDLGGDSLLISRTRSRLETILESKISIVDLFRYPTVRSLARFVENGEAAIDAFARIHDRAQKQLAAAGQARRRTGDSANV